MKTAFIFFHPFNGSPGSTVRVRELAISLHNLGAESYILTPYENNHNLADGVKVLSTGGSMQELGLAKYIYKLTKFAYYNSFFVKFFMSDRKFQAGFAKRMAQPIYKSLKELDVDLIQVEQDAAIPAAIEVKKKIELPLVADLHNITSEELVAAGVIRRDSMTFNKLQNRLASDLEMTDLVVVVSKEMKDYVIANYLVSPEKIAVVPPAGRPCAVLKKSPPMKIVYSGLVAYREHVDLFVRSMPIIHKKSVEAEFYITKKGDLLKEIGVLCKEIKTNPSFFWYETHEAFHGFLSSCHIGVLPSSNDLARRMGTPVKLFDYLSAGLPVVANNVGAWTDILLDEQVGIVTDNNPESFASGILKLASDQYLLEEYRKRCLKLVRDKFNWDNSAKTLLASYKSFA